MESFLSCIAGLDIRETHFPLKHLNSSEVPEAVLRRLQSLRSRIDFADQLLTLIYSLLIRLFGWYDKSLKSSLGTRLPIMIAILPCIIISMFSTALTIGEREKN